MSRILIVDDAAFMRMMLRNMLTKFGFEVVGEAQNGIEAIQQYLNLMPDVVTMDITMPEMDGILAVAAILKIDRKAKIIMCSAMAQKKMVVDAMMAGAKDFIVKPFQEEKVQEALVKVLAL
jgi:two-component system, chemotaxis family, chemotaxis protein CheY